MNFYGEPIFTPLSPDHLEAEADHLVALGGDVLDLLVWSDGPGEKGKPPRGLYGLPNELYRFGLACLALRARALSVAGKGFSGVYARLCKEHGFNRFDSSSRRHSMYFPILAEDDGFQEIVAEEGKRFEWLFHRPLVVVEHIAENVKRLRLQDAAIDWLPFGGDIPRT